MLSSTESAFLSVFDIVPVPVGTAASSSMTFSSSNSSISAYSSSSSTTSSGAVVVAVASSALSSFSVTISSSASSAVSFAFPSPFSSSISKISNSSTNLSSIRCCCSSGDITLDTNQSSSPHSSLNLAVSSSPMATEFSNVDARVGQGTLRVTRNCLSSGKYFLRFFGFPDSHAHVGHLYTNSSPAFTNSSGVRTPRVKKAESFRVGVAHSRALWNLLRSDMISG
mmetsp:Transcript_18845/g.28661  ORF Transcript_18845/g.28661 Transcript_18845/m.28661 type:complete len:225 (+) Transcript_18845:473-1147(+)